MFKVVLAGDAAVGKSSLIMRLTKGKFLDNLSSTLGMLGLSFVLMRSIVLFLPITV